jgi:hypothetical protein
MSILYKLDGFDRATERLVLSREIPAELVARVKHLAGRTEADAADYGDRALADDQAAAVAALIGEAVDPERCEYSLAAYSQPLHAISKVALLGPGKLQLIFDDREIAAIDLGPLLAQAGVFAPLRDPRLFARVQIGPSGRSLVWRQIGEKNEQAELSADALWLMAHPPTPPS